MRLSSDRDHGPTADETSYINYIKPLILAAELDCPHVLSVIDTKDQWFYRIHPERMVPSLKDKDPVTGEEVVVFEGTACLQYLADRFDTEGAWTGRTAFEKGNVYAWTAYQTAGIGYVQTFGARERRAEKKMRKTFAKSKRCWENSYKVVLT